MTEVSSKPTIQAPPAEELYQKELRFLEAFDSGPRPPGWRMTPQCVVTFVAGSRGESLCLPEDRATEGLTTERHAKGLPEERHAEGLPEERHAEGLPNAMSISEKFVGDRALVERCVVTLAGQRGLLLVGEPGTAKSMLSELLAAAICGSSALTVQGTAGTTEEQLRYGWNYSLLLARGPHPEALVPSPILTAMRRGAIARVEEVTRCLPEVQDALVSILSDRRMAIPELPSSGTEAATLEYARKGFNLIATANLRDRGVSEMSAALKRRFNFEIVPPIRDAARETALVKRQAEAALAAGGHPLPVGDAVLEALVTAFRDLREGRSLEGWVVERPGTVMSTAEAVGVATSLGFQAAYFPGVREAIDLLPGYLLGVVLKDDPKDRGRLLAYWDSVVKRRADQGAALWRRLLEKRGVLEE